MLHWIISTLWSSIFAQIGLSGLVLAGAVAVYIYIPLPSARHLAISVASVCIVLIFLGTKFYGEGVRHERAQWKAAEQRAVELGDRARADALRDTARGLRDDFDDDSH